MRVSKGPRYYKSKKAWFANLHGERVPLVKGPKGATEAEANRKYNDLVMASSVADKKDDAKVWAVLNAYLAWAAARTTPPLEKNTLEIYGNYVQSACEAFGEVAVKDLSHVEINSWLASQKKGRGKKDGWGPGGRLLAIRVLKVAFRWASGPGKICTKDPTEGMGRLSSVNYRGAKTILTPEAFRDLVALSIGRGNRDFAYVLLLLNATGARPGEIAKIRAEEWDDGLGAFVIEPQNGSGRFKLASRGNQRVIYVPDDLVPLVKSIIARRKSGRLFVGQKGGEITTKSTAWRIKRARDAGVAIPKNFTMYGFRHGFVTRWMMAPGCDVKTLATLINTSIGQIEKTYSHLFKEHDTLREAVRAFGRSRGQGGGET